jgi:hypothetical protein
MLAIRYLCLALFIFAFTSEVVSQPLFEEGYYLDLEKNKHEGLISLNSIIDHHSYILFKNTHRAKPDTIFKNNVHEVKVSNFRFVRENVRMLATGTTLKDSLFVEQSLLLQVEMEGEATLYSRQVNEDHTFYFSLPGRTTEQLYYLEYVRSDGKVARDNAFREQLMAAMNCNEVQLAFLKYEITQLLSAFSDFNACKKSDFKTYNGLQGLSFKYLNIGMGVGTSPYFIESTNTIEDTEIARFTGNTPYIEADIEYLIPSLSNRIGFFITGGYLKFSDSDERVLLGTEQNIELDYQVFQSTIGVRGYWPFNNTLKLYGEVGLGKDFEIGKGISIDYSVEGRGYQDFENTKLTGHLTGGLGIAFYNRYMVEAKFKHLNTQISSRSSDQRVKQAFLMIGFKYLLKSYYK